MKWTTLLLLLCVLLPGCRTNETPEAQVDDLKIAAQVKSKLASEVGVESIPNIAVNSTNGIVTLSGQVDSADTKAKAETIAKSVDKVVRVINVLQVASKPDTKSIVRPSRSDLRRFA
ncbi:MAG TPA: BON domain-containing protein [Bryobacteraceae bacterium]|nr:BON domain-containing protein [Bryobacteraceae bacterium]